MKRTGTSLIWKSAVLFAAALSLAAATAAADEGMWTFDKLPLKQIQERYGFTPSRQWIEHVQKSCVRFGGASGSFVSPEGLVLTNHHVAFDQLQKLSTREKNYVRDGFYARTRAEELPCPDQELRVLISTEDVTAQVLAAIDPKAPEKRQSAQRKAVIAKLERVSTDATKLKSEIVELYRGGQYWLYRYKVYTDVRLVMAPESRAAFYGGDLDNFTYPRHDVDIAFFRVYENGQPLNSTDYLRMNPAGPRERDLVFVAGHPGSTSRLKTVSQIEYERDYDNPLRLKRLALREKAYNDYAARGPEEARRCADRIKGLENGLKRLRGFRDVLQDPAVLKEKRDSEASLRARVASDPALAASCGGAWDRIAAAQQEMIRRHREYIFRDMTRVCRLVDMANTIVRYVAEVDKPNDERLSEFGDPRLDSVRFRLFSRAPLFPDMEEHILAATLQEMRNELGPDDAFVKAALDGRPGTEVAHELFSGTGLADVAVRKRLIEGGRQAVEASADPLIVWARKLDAPYRELRAWHEDQVETVELTEGNKIARALFALDGDSVYPDATGTLRLSYGKTAGYEEGTTRVPWKTTFYGLYDRAASFDNREPFDMPPRFTERVRDLDLSTPLNFVATDDIVGGNSGSPVISTTGECVGVVFDGNIPGFAWDYVYTDVRARMVAVHAAAIIESLRQLYGMDALADELEGRGSPAKGTR